MRREVKHIKLNNMWGIDCVTVNGAKGITYEVNITMDSVPWREEIEKNVGLPDKDSANRVFKEMVLKYKNL